jgi:hypothetical protein
VSADTVLYANKAEAAAPMKSKFFIRFAPQMHLLQGGEVSTVGESPHDICFARYDVVLASFSSSRYRPGMPKDAFILSDVLEPTLTVVCEPCGRRGRYNVAQLREKYGDAKLLRILEMEVPPKRSPSQARPPIC